MLAEPIVEELDDDVESLISLKENLDEEASKMLFAFPVVYIHNWKHNDYLFDAYVGEANDVLNRTRYCISLFSTSSVNDLLKCSCPIRYNRFPECFLKSLCQPSSLMKCRSANA